MTRTKKNHTTLFAKLAASEYKAHYDAACKRLISEKQILARIMKYTLNEYKHLSIPRIIACIEGNPVVGIETVFPNTKMPVIRGDNTEDASIDEGIVHFDIKFRALIPRSDERKEIIINVEAQNNFYQKYPIIVRAIYYVSRMISSQYGTEFTNSEYEKIKKVASIWICPNPPKYRRNTINRYRLKEEMIVGNTAEKVKNYDLLSVVLVCLGGPNQDNYNKLIKMLDVLLSSTINHETKRQILETQFGIEMTEEIEEELDTMCNLSQGIEDRGIRKGERNGQRKGVKKQAIRDIKNLMESFDISAVQAMEALKIPKSKQKEYKRLILS